ncbi:MAG: SulP family inorganic anion transporter [Bdellovibrionales bacterium]|nr:SulP family inorganic anion transporter [Bdellovibrionales bacterium]
MISLKQPGISRDVLAGLTLAAVGIPEVMGYTRIIGTPVITGLYTLLLPVILFALFGSSRRLVIGADSATAAVVAAALVGMASHSTPEYVELTALIALISGVLLLLARVLHLGFVANFLSRTVLIGFLSGVGVQVAIGELRGMDTDTPSLILAAAALVVLFGFQFFAPRWPGALIAVVVSIIASYTLDFHSMGIAILGDVPSGLPEFSLPTLSFANVTTLMTVSISCVFVILAQSAATARAYALRYGESLDEDRDLIGLGLANLGAALSGTFVVNGSPTKTEILDAAGGRSQWAQLTTALTVLLVLLFLTGPLAYLPRMLLTAIVFMIGVRLIDWRGLKDIQQKSRSEFLLALLTAATVVFIGVEQGIALAMVLSLLNHVRNSYEPRTALVTPGAEGEWKLVPVSSAACYSPGLLIYWFGADLFYANADRFVQELEVLADSCQPKWLAIQADAITDIDYSAGNEVHQILNKLAARGITVVWVQMNAAQAPIGRRFSTVAECAQAYEDAK